MSNVEDSILAGRTDSHLNECSSSVNCAYPDQISTNTKLKCCGQHGVSGRGDDLNDM